MKKIFNKYIAFFLPIVSVVVLAGCSDKDLPEPSGSTKGGITAVVNGVDWESSSGSYKLGLRTIPGGANAFVDVGDTLTIIGVQVQGIDTTAIMLSVKLTAGKVGSYRFRSGTTGNTKAYFFTGVSDNDLEDTKEKYNAGITNGELRITEYDPTNSSISGDFGFSMSATDEITYTIVAGKIENVTF